MIYLLSDIHGGESIRGLEKYLSFCTALDTLIILGDLGLNFEDTEANRGFTRFFEALDNNIVLIDGNHENFDYINSFPTCRMYGGEVRKVSEKIVYLKRGGIYNIEGHSFFVMGGCKSSAKWKEMGLWSPLEEPDGEEIARAYENLKKCNNRVDFILTHKYVKTEEGENPMTLEGLLGYIDRNVEFGHWYSGHWHERIYMDLKHTVVYDAPVKI